MRPRGLTTDGRAPLGVGSRNRQSAMLLLVAPALVLAAAWLLWSTPALAHTDLTATRPADKEVLADPVNRIELEFSGAVDTGGTSIRLLDGDGADMATTTTHVSETLVVVEPDQELGGGRFAVLWSVRSASDGHDISGSFRSHRTTQQSPMTPCPTPPRRRRLQQLPLSRLLRRHHPSKLSHRRSRLMKELRLPASSSGWDVGSP